MGYHFPLGSSSEWGRTQRTACFQCYSWSTFHRRPLTKRIWTPPCRTNTTILCNLWSIHESLAVSSPQSSTTSLRGATVAASFSALQCLIDHRYSVRQSASRTIVFTEFISLCCWMAMVENAGTLVHLLEVIAVSAKYLALSVLRASRAIPEFPSFPVGKLALIPYTNIVTSCLQYNINYIHKSQRLEILRLILGTGVIWCVQLGPHFDLPFLSPLFSKLENQQDKYVHDDQHTRPKSVQSTISYTVLWQAFNCVVRSRQEATRLERNGNFDCDECKYSPECAIHCNRRRRAPNVDVDNVGEDTGEHPTVGRKRSAVC